MWLSAFVFVAFVGLTAACVAGAVLFKLSKRSNLARATTGGAIGAVLIYTLLLLASGAASNGQQLSKGSEKHICELDCHLAYAVMDTKRSGGDYEVTLRVRFDETTTSARRDDSQLYPGGRKILLVDANGHAYEPVEAKGLETPLRPGQSIAATVRFAIPADAQPATLRFEDADPSKKLLLGSETAPLHKRTTFRLS
ncbi:MAG TPA: hypothetical protein VM100_00685 [Longimicrobiales bacterium]|nr:hypothetical protein [Longimicrobiales bacterium]